MSIDKKELINSISQKTQKLSFNSIVKDPYILEFTGLEAKVKYSENDNPPIGLILCANKNSTKVEYATAGLDNKLFVSKYKINLPSVDEIESFIHSELEEIILKGESNV